MCPPAVEKGTEGGVSGTELCHESVWGNGAPGWGGAVPQGAGGAGGGRRAHTGPEPSLAGGWGQDIRTRDPAVGTPALLESASTTD